MPGLIAATVATALFLAVAVLSVRAARRRVSYETWPTVDLLVYVAVALSSSHQLAGPDLAGHRLLQLAWALLYTGVFALVIEHRVLTPLRNAGRHRMRVAAVHQAAPGVVSIEIEGRDLHELRAESSPSAMPACAARRGSPRPSAPPCSRQVCPSGSCTRRASRSDRVAGVRVPCAARTGGPQAQRTWRTGPDRKVEESDTWSGTDRRNDMDDDRTTRPARRPSALAMLAAGTLGAAVLGIGGVAYAQSAAPADPDAGVTQDRECEDRAGRGDPGTDSTSPAPSADTSSADA